MLRYAGMQTACDIAFGAFVIVWFVARHVIYLSICWSLYVDVPIEMPTGCYDLSTGKMISSDGGNEIWSNVLHAYIGGSAPVCFNERIRLSFLGLLLTLQVLMLVWFYMIARVVYRVLSGQGADDTRSDDEGEEEQEELDVQQRPIAASTKRSASPQTAAFSLKEKEVDAEELHFVRRAGSPKTTKRSKGRASGISIPGHTDHKAILGRIGCDRPGGGA